MAARGDESHDTDRVENKTIYSHPGAKTKSDVWKYFGFFKIHENLPPSKTNLNMKEAVCRLCRKTYKNTGNTTNFNSHIQGEHKLLKLIKSENGNPCSAGTESQKKGTLLQRTILNFKDTTKGKLGPERNKAIEEKLLKHLIGKVLPPSLVDNFYFKDFVASLEPRYQIPSRKTVMAKLEQRKEEVEARIKDELQSVEGIAITHDGWTSNATESYNTTTIHYIHDWKLKCSVLNTVKMDGSHTAERIANSLLQTKAKWSLPDKLVATTDNAANEKKAFQILKWKRFGCYGHKINLVVKNAMGIPELAKILVKSRKLVTLFHTSTSVNDKLMDKQKLLLQEKLHGHKLIADVPTRWNSTLAMLQRILEQLPALMAVATDETLSKSAKTTIQNCLLTFDETTFVERVVNILEPFKKATDAVCSETNPTINKVLPMVTKLFREVDEDKNDPKPIKALKGMMRDQMKQRTEVEDISLLGTVLNPYTKGFEHMPQERTRAEELLYIHINDLMHVTVKVKREKDDAPSNVPQTPSLPVAPEGIILDFPVMEDIQVKTTDDSPEYEEQPPTKKVKLLSSADTDEWLSDVMCVGESQTSPEDIIREEVNRYLHLVLKQNEKKVTVLEWWQSNELYFPRLAKLAKQVLCVQASSVPSERVFSLAGELVSKKRSRLSPNNVDMFIFLHKNLNKFW